MAKPDNTLKRKEREEKEDAEDGLKFVINGAKLKCELCTVPAGDLKVNFDTPTIQDKKVATVVEKDMKSLIFKGNCKKSPNSASPCASVMKLADWKDVGTVYFQDKFPLLLKSTIKCEYGGVDIKITDSAQRNKVEKIETTGAPVPNLEAMVTDAYFAKKIDNNYKKISWSGINDEVYLVVKTIGLIGKVIEINLKDKDGIITNEKYGIIPFLQDDSDKKGKFSAVVDSNNLAVFKLQLKPSKNDKEIEEWRNKIAVSADKKAYLCILVDAGKHNPDLNITYNGKNSNNDKTSEKSEKSNYWLDIQGKWFELRRKNPTIVVDPGHGYTKGNTGAVSWIYTYKLKDKEGKVILDDKKQPKTEKNNVEQLPQYVIDNPTEWIISTKEDPNRSERFLVYDVSNKLKQLLENNGYTTLITRERGPIAGADDPATRKARIDLAIENKADYFISIHADGATGYTSSGSHVIYPSSDNSECIELATDIFSSYNIVEVESTSPKSDVRGLQVLSQKSNTIKRKVLVELGFVTTPKDSKALFMNINQIAQQLYDGLVKNINKNF
ncbi:hypothetical protein ASF10_08845 [Flavobacterium sp. Leaf82]|uniref:N-acetylmuramoyl-L-alanine amidase n=1 Tax=Flavobacterium sp. Leaf82 TaxID=1736238 RepID=UPI0007007489|nr:N-acetylmuramoyl-L-alanine amidase [Flavobacterium sp. Leaf82]KQO22474.1 hypothetical protein ASF10_08845 [Flavobacterium sp. Leaf82]